MQTPHRHVWCSGGQYANVERAGNADTGLILDGGNANYWMKGALWPVRDSAGQRFRAERVPSGLAPQTTLIAHAAVCSRWLRRSAPSVSYIVSSVSGEHRTLVSLPSSYFSK